MFAFSVQKMVSDGVWTHKASA